MWLFPGFVIINWISLFFGPKKSYLRGCVTSFGHIFHHVIVRTNLQHQQVNKRIHRWWKYSLSANTPLFLRQHKGKYLRMGEVYTEWHQISLVFTHKLTEIRPNVYKVSIKFVNSDTRDVASLQHRLSFTSSDSARLSAAKLTYYSPKFAAAGCDCIRRPQPFEQNNPLLTSTSLSSHSPGIRQKQERSATTEDEEVMWWEEKDEPRASREEEEEEEKGGHVSNEAEEARWCLCN